MKLETVLTVKVLAKNKETLTKADGKTEYKTFSIACVQGSEMCILPVPENIYEIIKTEVENTFIANFFDGVIDGKSIKSFKIKDIIPFSGQNQNTHAVEKK